MRVVFVTCAPGQAESLLKKLLEERLVACGNILPGARSLYWWKGEICEDSEEVRFMETSDLAVQDLVARVKELHSYETPKIITLPVAESEQDYLSWLLGVTRPRAQAPEPSEQ